MHVAKVCINRLHFYKALRLKEIVWGVKIGR